VAGPNAVIARAEAFCRAYDLRLPILMAPMAGASPPELAIEISRAGGMGAAGVLLMGPDLIADWAATLRAATDGAFMLNTWIPDPEPDRDLENEAALRRFLGQWGPDISDHAPNVKCPDFEEQCAAMLKARPAVISSIMGLFSPDMVAEMRARGIKWFATATTVAEAVAANEAGADVIVAQGAEAGGHRGAFRAEDAAREMVGLFSLVPAVVDAVDVPVVAAGGIADARGVAAALILGASAVQIGTGLLRAPEAGISPAWADAIGAARPEGTVPTRAFSGRLARAIRTPYVEAAAGPDAPPPAPYPIQRALTGPMRNRAAREDRIDAMQAWAGQSAGLSRATPAGDLVTDLWDGARRLIGA